MIMAEVVKAEGAARLLKEAACPLVVIGSQASNEVLEAAVRIAKGASARVAATGNTVAALKGMGLDAKKEWTIEIVNRMTLPQGFEGEDKPDLLVFIGFYPYVLHGVLSTLKHFSECRTLVLERRYFESADFSFPKMSKREWVEELRKVAEGVSV